MTEDKFESGATPFELALLEAGRSELPDDQQTAQMLGVLGPRLVETAVEGPQPSGRSQTGTYRARKAGAAAAIFWSVALGSLAAAAGGAYFFMLADSGQQPEPTATPTNPAAPEGASAVDRDSAVATPAEDLSVETAEPEPQETEPVPAIVSKVPKTSPSKTSGNSSLEREMAILDQVRKALSQKDADYAVVLLDGYKRRFPQGILSQEATVLRVQALALKGSLQEANALRTNFLRDNPGSAHQERLGSESSPK